MTKKNYKLDLSLINEAKKKPESDYFISTLQPASLLPSEK